MKKISLIFLVFFMNFMAVKAQMIDNDIRTYTTAINPDSMGKHIAFLQSFGTRWSVAPNHRAVAYAIKAKFEKYGLEVRVDSFYRPNTYHYNLTGIRRGVADTNQIYIIGAHSDGINKKDSTKVPAADDNGSGMAALFEIARVMQQQDFHPTNSIYFIAFAQEEYALQGSGVTSGLLNQSKQIQYMLNNDMIANNSQSPNGWKVKFKTYPRSESLTNMAIAACHDFTTLTDTIINDSCFCTDSYPFFAWGNKTIFFHEYNFSPHYHSESDSLQYLDMNYCAEITRISMALLLRSTGQTNGIMELKSKCLRVHPNPATEKLTVETNNATGCIRIFTMQGQMLMSKQISSNATIVDINELQDGMYFIQVWRDDTIDVVKFIKE